MKRFVSVLMSVWLVLLCAVVSPARVQAEVLEPEVVRTETWTTSYYIDDEVDTLYPYIECKADIYNDGSMIVSIRNTHEWDGFRTVQHTCTIVGTTLVKQYETIYLAKNGLYKDVALNNYYYSFMEPDPQLANIDVNYYSKDYYCFLLNGIFKPWKEIVGSIKSREGDKPNTSVSVYSYYYTGYLCDFSTDNITSFQFIPTVEPTGTYDFRIFGHDITITPELLSTTDFTVYTDDQTQQIHELEGQINDLNSEIERLKAELEVAHWNQDRLIEDIDCLYDDIDKLMARRGDINDDGQYTVADVVLLARYVAGTIDSIPYYPPE